METIINAAEVKKQLPETDPNFKILHFNGLVEDELKRVRQCSLGSRDIFFKLELSYNIFGTEYESVAELITPHGYEIVCADNAKRVWKVRIK